MLQVNGSYGLCCESSTVLLGLMVMMMMMMILVVLVKVLMLLLLLLLLLLCSVHLLCNLAPHGPFNCSDNVLQPCSHVKLLIT